MKKLITVILALSFLLSHPIYANEATLNREECIAILEAQGVEFDKTATIETTEFITDDNRVIEAISIAKEGTDYGSKTTVLFLKDGNDLIDASKSLSYSSKWKAGTISNVMITAYYYYSTTTIDGTVYRLYRPYKLTSVSTVSQNMYIRYYTYGVKYDLNGNLQYQLTDHTITNSAYPATVNHLYSLTNTYNGYIAGSQVSGGASLEHRVYATINGSNAGYFKVTSDSI